MKNGTGKALTPQEALKLLKSAPDPYAQMQSYDGAFEALENEDGQAAVFRTPINRNAKKKSELFGKPVLVCTGPSEKMALRMVELANREYAQQRKKQLAEREVDAAVEAAKQREAAKVAKQIKQEREATKRAMTNGKAVKVEALKPNRKKRQVA